MTRYQILFRRYALSTTGLFYTQFLVIVQTFPGWSGFHHHWIKFAIRRVPLSHPTFCPGDQREIHPGSG
ncbi:hypothetical protein BDV24DRAFT_136669 [Aspergillus arachidicola]|uniref:Uncharacterized protein n=1 Tax=Aspergillus arachidicola TaxID=656916 RepID=A0A5N6Y1N5_9EURO|nr:hypothetical protein BDV24DRAFT_136669 [Aspergillus arachidicola]